MKIHKIVRLCIVAATAATIYGCATTSSPAEKAKLAKFNATIPTCSGDADCKVKWQAAQLWVVHNSGYKIQTATDVLIETYNPGEGDTELAAQVTKEPMGGGKYKIVIKLWCDNIFGCVRDPLDASIDFNQTVSAASP